MTELKKTKRKKKQTNSLLYEYKKATTYSWECRSKSEKKIINNEQTDVEPESNVKYIILVDFFFSSRSCMMHVCRKTGSVYCELSCLRFQEEKKYDKTR